MTDKTVKCGTETCFYNSADAACKGSTDPNAATCAGAPNDNVCAQANECFSNCECIESVFDMSLPSLSHYSNPKIVLLSVSVSLSLSLPLCLHG
jgi:hypothetical protein